MRLAGSPSSPHVCCLSPQHFLESWQLCQEGSCLHHCSNICWIAIVYLRAETHTMEGQAVDSDISSLVESTPGTFKVNNLNMCLNSPESSTNPMVTASCCLIVIPSFSHRGEILRSTSIGILPGTTSSGPPPPSPPPPCFLFFFLYFSCLIASLNRRSLSLSVSLFAVVLLLYPRPTSHRKWVGEPV